MKYFIEIILVMLAVEGCLKFFNIERGDGVFFIIQYLLSSVMVWTLLVLLERYILSK